MARGFLLPAAIAATFLALLPSVQAMSDPPPTKSDEIVWHWFASCADPKRVTVEVQLDGKQVYAQTFGLCHVSRSSIQPEPVQRILSFDLQDKKQRFFGERKGTQLEGSIWEAGEDSYALVLGVSFADKEQVWCNTLHFVDPSHPSRLRLTKGLVVMTYPAR